MDKVIKKSLKKSNKDSLKLEKKVKSSLKNKDLIINEVNNEEVTNTIEENLNKIRVEVTQQQKENSENKIDNETVEVMDVDKDSTIYNGVIANLPSEATKEEIVNFLSNRGIPIDDLIINENKYAIIECDDHNMLSKVTSIILDKPMKNNSEMKAMQLFGNQKRLETFNGKNSIPNKRIVIVKNIELNTKINDVLALINDQDEILKHSVIKVRNRGVKTQMLTIEFKSASHTDGVIKKINKAEVDGHKLIAEYKCNFVDIKPIENEIKTDTFIIKNLPLTSDKESVRELIKNFNVSQKNIQITKKSGKKCCFVKFNSVEEATAAYNALLEDLLDGVKLDIKFVGEKKVTEEGELAKTKLHITNLPFTVKREDIEKEFDMAESIKFPLTESGKSKGCCYLTFASEEMAALAYDGFQDKVIEGRKIKCQYAKVNVATEEEKIECKKRTRSKKDVNKVPGTVLTLFNLPAGVTQKDIMSNFSNVKLFNIVKKGESFKGIAEVHFKDVAAANAAMSAPEFSLKGRVIRKELKGGKWRNGTEPKKVTKPAKSVIKPNTEVESMEN